MSQPLLLFSGFTLFVGSLIFSSGTARQPDFQNRHNDTLPVVHFSARDHLGKSIISERAPITFSSGLHNDFFEMDAKNRIAYLYLEARSAKVATDSVRVPLNISIVIDRSGSMEGVKMGFAKKAAKSIIEKLSANDFVSIVIYDNNIDSVQVPTHVTDKEAIFKKINSIAPRGSTNLWGGTELGYRFVQRNYRPGYVNRVLLISDGLANSGITDATIIHNNVLGYKNENGITLSTFGVGLDYNEALMTDMAETGLGNYYFIDSPEKITLMFNTELQGLLAVAARDAAITLDLPAGVKLLETYPLNYVAKEGRVSISMKDIFSEERRGTMLAFSIPDNTRVPLHFISELSFTDVRTGKSQTVRHDNTLSPVSNNTVYLSHFNRPVMEQVVLSSASENFEHAMSAAELKQFKIAMESLQRNRSYLNQNNLYVGTSPELQRMDSINNAYMITLNEMSRLGTDSVKKIQKQNRLLNYKVRRKQ